MFVVTARGGRNHSHSYNLSPASYVTLTAPETGPPVAAVMRITFVGFGVTFEPWASLGTPGRPV
ncbi:hypothetical protein ACTU45_33705 [Streptomyces sp. 24-1644]|uniref:hypothetical protein n=1 Tax=Streptomyces sp. 24-1644 TaxID=3457315 RepID=UPI003FA7C4D5